MDTMEQIETKFRKIEVNDKVSYHNKQRIREFYNKCLSEGMSIRRILKYLNYMSIQAEVLGIDFEKAEKPDIERLLAWIEGKQNWAEWTKHDNKVMLKKFYKWLEGDDEEFPKKVRWIKVKMKVNKVVSPNELLNDKDVKAMIEACTYARDRALVSVIYESGCRISEILNMKVKDAEQDDYGFVIHVAGKTGQRRIRLIDSVPYISTWIAHHTGNKDSYLWVGIGTSNHGEQLCYNTVRGLLVEIAKKSGVTKPVNPHNFRKSNSTKLASCMTEFELKERQGWVQSSKMASIYVRLSGRDVDEAYFKAKGICISCKKAKAISNYLCEACFSKPNGKENILEPKLCPRCTHKCEATAKVCSQCAFPMTERSAVELLERRRKADNFMNTAIKYPELIEVLEKIARKEKLT